MNSFWKIFWASLLSLVTVGVICWGIVFLVIYSLIPEEKEFKVEQHSVLKIELNGPIGERSRVDVDFGLSFAINNIIGVDEILTGIDAAKEDEDIDGIYLNLKNVGAGIASLEEIRNKLKSFKESGKFIYAYAENYGQKEYYLASVADGVYIVPSGMFDWRGLGTERMFFAKALKNLDVEVQVIRGSNNKFKSAVEPFLYEKMSDESKLQTKLFLNQIWNQIALTVSESRSIDTAKLNVIANDMLTRSPQKSVELGFFEKTAFEDEVFAIMKDKTGQEEVKFIEFNDYVMKRVRKNIKLKSVDSETKIALIVAEGEIVDGNQPLGKISSERYVKAIREARNDDEVKAIVLRVNSPGGSALASDIIWRELMLAKKDMPVIVSMGDVAASGGYYISCAGDRIFADKTTITGSIGVFGLIPYVGKFFENKVGITFDRVGTHKHSVFSLNQKLTEDEYAVIQQGVDAIYEDFVAKVSEGRRMTRAEVDSIAKGRVWSGVEALKVGLIDEFGGLDEAMNYTLDKIGKSRDDVKITVWPKDPNAKLAELMDMFGAFDDDEKASVSVTTLDYPWMKDLTTIQDVLSAHPYQTRMPYMKVID